MEHRHLIGILAAVVYVAFTQRERLKTLAYATFAKLRPIAGSGKSGWLVAAVIGGVTFWPDITPMLPWPSPVIEVRQPDVFDDACLSGRVLISEALDEIAGMKFDSSQAAEDFTNDKILDCMEAAFPPIAEQIEKARASNRLTEMAAKLKAGELRDE
jgi:hypothetical protein